MRIRSAIMDDLPAIMALQQRVVASLASPEMLYADPVEFYATILREGGSISLAENQCLAGCSILRLPSADDEENLGYDLGLSVTECGAVAHLEVAYLLPEYRGRGLGRELGERNLRLAAAAGRYLVCATAFPENESSIKNLRSLGLSVVGEKEKYGGLKRLLFLRDLRTTQIQKER